MKLTGAAILVSRGMKVLRAAPAAYSYGYAARVTVGTMFAMHVGTPKTNELSARLAPYGTVFTESGSEFCAVDLPIEERPSEKELADLVALSREFDTDVLWLGFSSVSDSFRFHHWQSGQEVRALAFVWSKEQGVWELAEGEPEPWERSAFFLPRTLAIWSEEADEAEAKEMRRVWAAAEVRAGGVIPPIDARESARAVAEYYGLPGWS